MLNFSDFNKKIHKGEYQIVKSRSGLPMFVIEPPDSLNNITSDDIHINITEDQKFKMERLKFYHIKTDYGTDDNVLITVIMDTSNRDESFSNVRNCIITEVENII